jgi:hypothetical protein
MPGKKKRASKSKVRPRKKVNLGEIFDGLQMQMEAKLTLNRKVVHHPGAKGTASELEWISMLTTYLPRRYCADKAFVIDADGNVSDEIDIVIYDRQYSPFILQQNGVSYIPAECVYAVIEVKQVLDSRTIKYAQSKAASVRRLSRTSVPIKHAGGEFAAKPPGTILAGLVALDGRLTDADHKKIIGADELRILHLGCSLAGKTYFSLQKVMPCCEGESPYAFRHSVDKGSLVKFFLTLVRDLQALGTVTAMDVNRYLMNAG